MATTGPRSPIGGSGSDAIARVLAYHGRTKHHTHRFAHGPGAMDWDNQPDPFRTYVGATRFDLPLVADGVETPYDDLYRPAGGQGAVGTEPRALDGESLGAFFELALGLTAWKEYGDTRWSLRSDPSSGNLHPTEGYAVLPELVGVGAGVHHYVSRDHCLERRCHLDADAARELQRRLPAGGFLFGISSIHWRESWKYGERAFRYCQHDAGHVIGTARLAAAALGWTARLLDGWGDGEVAALLGLDRDADYAGVDPHDREHADAVLLIAPAPGSDDPPSLDGGAGELAGLVARGEWRGTPNVLSAEHVDWAVIEDAAQAARRPTAAPDPCPAIEPVSWTPLERRAAEDGAPVPAATIIRQRRSAVAFEGSSITAHELYAMLERLLPRPAAAPWDVLPWAPKLHLGIFVHRVDGLTPGFYLLERRAGIHDAFVEMLGADALWKRPDGCPEHLRLFCIGEIDARRTAAAVSCGQDIAGDGAFSLGMIAEFRSTIDAGAFWYRRLFWESGVIGQVLYLEAEAIGIRATGIGCYFDDAFHQVAGLEGDRFQSLYHFTVGSPIDDDRLVTLPPYGHLERS